MKPKWTKAKFKKTNKLNAYIASLPLGFAKSCCRYRFGAIILTNLRAMSSRMHRRDWNTLRHFLRPLFITFFSFIFYFFYSSRNNFRLNLNGYYWFTDLFGVKLDGCHECVFRIFWNCALYALQWKQSICHPNELPFIRAIVSTNTRSSQFILSHVIDPIQFRKQSILGAVMLTRLSWSSLICVCDFFLLFFFLRLAVFCLYFDSSVSDLLIVDTLVIYRRKLAILSPCSCIIDRVCSTWCIWWKSNARIRWEFPLENDNYFDQISFSSNLFGIIKWRNKKKTCPIG